MLISFNWIKKYVDLPDSVSPEEVANKLLLSTVEVERIEYQGKDLDGVVVGEILEIKDHSNANKLHIAQVAVGEEKPRQVIFGEMIKMQVGFKVPVALAPTILPGDRKIESVKMRGELTEGMFCLDQELGLLKDGVSIHFFDKKVKNGTKLIDALGLNDAILEIDNKSITHRPDLWGHYGIAREVAALYNKKLSALGGSALGGKDFVEMKEGKEVDLKIKIEDKENCTRYIGAVVGGIKIAPSPEWLQKLLTACGIKSINNVVDITNYVTWELGRPSHAFDRRDIKNDTIIVRRAKPGEKLTTLDGVERILTDQMCLVCDAKRPVDLGGIMGGLNSEIKDDTTEIILELANFNSANIRRTMQAFGLRTDAGVRFEKTLSPYLAELGMKRILTLIKQLIPSAYLMSKIVDVDYTTKENRKIEMSLEFLQKKMGVKIEKKQAIKILESIGFVVEDKKGIFTVTVPLWRSVKDISLPEDLVEEIARIYGFDNIKTQLPSFPIVPPERNELRLLERKIKNILSLEYTFTESYNYSFVSPEWLKKIGLSTEGLVELQNPIAKDRPFLRHNLWPNLLENVEKNQRFAASIKLFEIGKVFTLEKPGQRIKENSDELLPRQDSCLCLVYSAKNEQTPFVEVSNAFIGLMEHLNAAVEFKPNDKIKDNFVHAGRQAVVYVNGLSVGAVAELNPITQQNIGLENRVALLEVDLDELLTVLKDRSKYQPLPIYPEVVRDIAFVVDKNITHAEIVNTLQKVDPLIKKVELFDVYEGTNLKEGRKSMAYHITYLSPDRTLIAEEVDKIQTKVVKLVEDKFKGEVRK